MKKYKGKIMGMERTDSGAILMIEIKNPKTIPLDKDCEVTLK